LFVDASGFISLGTATPSAAKFTFNSAGTNEVARFESTDAGAFIAIKDSASSSINYIDGSGDNLIFGTNNAERARIDSTGRLGLGTSSPGGRLELNTAVVDNASFYTGTIWNPYAFRVNQGNVSIFSSGGASSAGDSYQLSFYGRYFNTGQGYQTNKGGYIRGGVVSGASIGGQPSGRGILYLGTSTTDYSGSGSVSDSDTVVITNGRVGIGTTDPSTVGASAYRDLVIAGTGNRGITIQSSNSAANAIVFNDTNGGVQGAIAYSHADDSLQFAVNGNERARIDSSGRLLVGTSTAPGAFPSGYIPQITAAKANNGGIASLMYTSGNTPSKIYLGKSNTTTVGSHALVAADNNIGDIEWVGSDGSAFLAAARISAQVDGTPGASDMPGRLVFSTTADGASSPTERMRITSDGAILTGKTSDDSAAAGSVLRSTGVIGAVASADRPLFVNRLTSDGALVEFLQDTVVEGTISVSGTTVTYGGGHLARWSQLPNEEDPSGLLKGTVLSNLDEMCEWGEEDNEQLNKTKVSDVEGDPNVAGVFVSTSFSDDGPLDFFCAMTGDMIIRIAEGVTVQRGDLLMSAGDGTATPQDDDIIRSKTIAKVTSTHVTCTYDDGSYCVPCVLMAC
jgi:hypothetical protein